MNNQRLFLESFVVDGTMGHYRIGNPESGQWITSVEIPDFPSDTDCFFTPARLDRPFADRSSFTLSKFVWVDRDKISKPKFIIRPSWLVQSGTGQHIYFELTDPLSAVEVEELNKIMITLCDGDAALFPCTTLLRVPDTINTKYKPPKTATILEHSSIKYNPDFIRRLGKLNSKTINKVITGDSRGYQSRSERDWGVVGELISAGMSYEEVLMIYEYNKVGEKLAEEGGEAYLKRTYKELETRMKTKKVIDSSKPAQVGFFADTENVCYKWGNNQLSTFLFELLSVINVSNDDVLLRLRVITKKGKSEVVMPRRAFNSVREFDTYNKVLDAHWLGSDIRLRQLLAVMTDGNYTSVRGVRQTGLHNVDNTWTYVFSPDESTTQVMLLDRQYGVPVVADTTTDEQVLKQHLLNILKMNSVPTIWTMLSWYVASLAKPYLESVKYRFPILQITGTTGTGKTTTVHTLQRLLSLEPTTFDANTTNFVMLSLFGSTNALPVAISEHRSAENLHEFTRLVLLSYDSGHNARGRIDRTVEDYPLTAPLCVDGEDTFSDAASVQRTVICIFRGNGKQQDALKALAGNIGSLRLLSKLVLGWINSGRLLAEVEKYEKIITEDGVTSDRPAKNHAIVAAVGLLLSENLGVVFADKFWNESIGTVVPHGRPRLLVDDFMTDVINAIPNDQAKFTYAVYSRNQLVFQLATAHNWWMSRQRTRGGTVLDIDAIRRQLQERPYYHGYVRYKNVLCYLIDTEQAVEYGLEVPKYLEIQNE